jgi:hypothetical protein
MTTTLRSYRPDDLGPRGSARATDEELQRALGAHVEIVRVEESGARRVTPAQRALPPNLPARAAPLVTRNAPTTANRATPPAPGLQELIRAALRAQGESGVREFEDGRVAVDRKFGHPPASIGEIALRSALPDLLDADGRIYAAPAAMPSAEERTIRSTVAANSRCVRAGAHILEIAEPRLVTAQGRDMFRDVENRFVVVSPAPFPVVALDGDAGANAASWGAGSTAEGTAASSPMPTSTASLDRETLTQRAFRTLIPRSVLRTKNDGEVEREILLAVALGLGRALDAELLAALKAAATPWPGDFSAAAAAGLRFRELAAVIGTADVAGVVADRGELFYQGIPADISADCDATIIAAWNRYCIALEPSVRVLLERTNTGGLLATCWISLQALLPSAAFCWKVEGL